MPIFSIDRYTLFEVVAEISVTAVAIIIGWLVAEASALGFGLVATWVSVPILRDRIFTTVFEALRSRFPISAPPRNPDRESLSG